MEKESTVLPAAVQKAIAEFSRLPGIGPRSAQRLVFQLLKGDRESATSLARSLVELADRVRYCSVCGNYTEQDPCAVCSDKNRNREKICVVEQCYDVSVIERGGAYDGLYHVLGGSVSPLHGRFETDIRIPELMDRLEGITEILLATNANTEGEATALLIQKRIQESRRPIRITKIARGLPSGSDLEYADDATLSEAIRHRVEM